MQEIKKQYTPEDLKEYAANKIINEKKEITIDEVKCKTYQEIRKTLNITSNIDPIPVHEKNLKNLIKAICYEIWDSYDLRRVSRQALLYCTERIYPFNEHDYEKLPNGKFRWEQKIDDCYMSLREIGDFNKNSPQGRWTISQSGIMSIMPHIDKIEQLYPVFYLILDEYEYNFLIFGDNE